MRFPSPTRFIANRRGNVAMMYALMLPVLMFGAGFAIDYTHAMQVQTELDAAADAAVLAALTPSMMQQSDAAAQTAATNLFNAQANAISSLIATDTVLTVTVTNPNNNSLKRTVTVSYVAANQNIFASVLGYSALQVKGSSTASAPIAAEHRLLSAARQFAVDALAATTAGITQMESLTSAAADAPSPAIRPARTTATRKEIPARTAPPTPRRRLQRHLNAIARRRKARRSTIIRSRATTPSRCAWMRSIAASAT